MRGARISQKWEAINWNVTTKVMEALQSPKGRLAQIELLVFSAALLLIFLEVFGAYRRRCNNEKFRLILWTAYTIPPYLFTYTLGLMHAAPNSNELFVIWATFLMIVLGSADSFSAYNLEDNEQWKRYNWQWVIKFIGLLLLASLYANASTVMIAVSILYFVVAIKFDERARASMLASKGFLQKNTKLVADYTRSEHLKSNQDSEYLESNQDSEHVEGNQDSEHLESNQVEEIDLTKMKGYTYLVRGEEDEWEHYDTFMRDFTEECFKRKKVVEAKAPEYHVPFKLDSQVITVEKVWQCEGKLLKEKDSDHRIKDHCLSFALFKILSSIFAGYSMPQEVYHKSWELFQKIILDNGCERAFRIIEVELTFIFCQFYTKYQLMFQPRRYKIKLMELVLVCVGSCIGALILLSVKKSKGLSIDVLVTVVVIIAVLILEILQLLSMIFSEWGKVVLICNYVKRESWQKNNIEKLIEFICRTELLKPWERKLRQYSLLKSYGYSPSLLLYNNMTSIYMDQTKEGQEQSAPIELSTEVKSAVIDSLLIEGIKLENGKASLIRNNVQNCLWACDLETQAQVIMVWHIATSICEHEIDTNERSQLDTFEKFKIATSLSKYLAYLVAFAPRLLPDHPYVTEYVFDQVIVEARKTFKNCTSLEERIKELKDKRSRGGETVIDRGARLGMRLLDVKEPKIVWKVLADFWAELMLYVAPSNDMDAHAKHLTMGGEFVTQIWALLLHSGIGRDPLGKRPKLERS